MQIEHHIVIPKKVNAVEPSLKNLFDCLFHEEINYGDKVVIDISKTKFLSSELTAILSAVVNNWISIGAKVYINYSQSSSLSKQLQKNGFFSLFINKPTLPDVYDTVIPLFQGYSQDTASIESYLSNNVFSHKRWPQTLNKSSHEMETINSAIYEIARNINEHSGSNMLHMCGQFYPRNQQLCFALVDFGSTIPLNIRAHKPTLTNQSDANLINWATGRGNSTKKVAASGMGLFDICNSLHGHGELTVISNFGFWKQTERGVIRKATLPTKYPGTAIHLLFDFRNQHSISQDNAADDILDGNELIF